MKGVIIIDNLFKIFDNNLKAIHSTAISNISSWYDTDMKTFNSKNPDYKILEKSLKSSNELFKANLNDYHKWLTDNFIVSPKNQ